jgi:uncharacterized protein YggE
MTDTTLNIRHPLWLPILVVLIGGSFYIYGKNIEKSPVLNYPMIVSVSADAKVSASPDIAVLSFGIQTGRQKTAKAAIDNIQKNMAAILDAVKKEGVDIKDISTESFWLSPTYDYANGTQVPRGFEASQSLRVKVRNLDTVGDVLTAATNAGANQAGGVSFDIDNPDALMAEAREKAIDKAKAKADVLAKSLGMSVVKITGFSEGDGSVPPYPPMMARDSYGVGGGVMVEKSIDLPAGQQEISVTVTIMYEIR